MNRRSIAALAALATALALPSGAARAGEPAGAGASAAASVPVAPAARAQPHVLVAFAEQAGGVTSTPPSGPQPPPVKPADHPGLTGNEIAALVGAGVAVVGFGVGAAYGIDAVSRKNDAQSVCPGSVQCATQDGVSKWHDAEWAASASTFAFVIGCAGLLEAAVFWLMPDGEPTVQVGLGPGAVQVKGAW